MVLTCRSVELIKPYLRVFEGLVSTVNSYFLLLTNKDTKVTFFDVPLHYNFHNASKGGSAYDLRRVLDKSILQLRPNDAVSFVDNHEYVLTPSMHLRHVSGV